jgi:hypothetical protein
VYTLRESLLLGTTQHSTSQHVTTQRENRLLFSPQSAA